MKKIKVDIVADVKGQEKVEELNDTLQDTQQETENVNEGFEDMGNTADAALGGAVSKFKAFKSGIMSSVKSLGIMKVAIAATGLGALLILIGSIKAAFTSIFCFSFAVLLYILTFSSSPSSIMSSSSCMPSSIL